MDRHDSMENLLYALKKIQNYPRIVSVVLLKSKIETVNRKMKYF